MPRETKKRWAALLVEGLRRFVQQLAVQGMPEARDLALCHRGQHRALGFDQVAAIVELAVPQIRFELDEGALDHAFGQVVQAEFLKAWRIDDGSAATEVVQAGEGGGVLAGVEGG